MFSSLQIADNRNTFTARCRFLIYRNRGETETDLFVGERHDNLHREVSGFKIATRQIFLNQSVLLAKNLTLFS